MRPAQFLLASALLLGVAPALADPPRPTPRLALRFEYTRGPRTEACPTEHAVRDLLEGEFHYDPVKPDAAPRIAIAVTRKGSDFHAELAIYDDAGEVAWVEEMNDPYYCGALVRAAVLAAWIMGKRVLVKDGWAIPQPAAPPESPPPAPVPSAPAPVVPPAPAPVRAPIPSSAAAPDPSKLTYQIGGGLLGSLGAAPGVSMGVFGFAALHRGEPFSFAVELRMTRSVASTLHNGYSLRGLLVAGSMVPCYHRGFFLACAALHLGGLQGSGDRRKVTTADPFLLALGVRPGFERTWQSGLAVRGFVEPTVLVKQPSLRAEKRPEVWRASSMGVSIGLALTMPL